MLRVSHHLSIPEHEIEMQAIRSQGAGGQHVNKVSTAIHLRFDVHASSLPEPVKHRLLTLNDQRISRDGVVTIKSQSHRSQARNREEALMRLKALLQKALANPKKRYATKPSKTARAKRMDNKTRRGQVKSLRGKVKL